VRLVFEQKRPTAHVARDLDIHKEALRQRLRQVEADSGRRRDAALGGGDHPVAASP
jgi:transposase